MRLEKRRRKDGTETWRAVVRRAGQPIYTKTFLKRRDAEQWGLEQERRILRERGGLAQPVTQATIRQLLPSYLAADHQSSDATSRNRKAHLEWWAEQLPGPAAKVRGSRIRRVMQAGGKKGKTGNRYLTSLSVFYRWLIEEDLLDDNPCKNVRRASEKSHVIRYLSDEERSRLTESCRLESNEFFGFYLVSLWTGGRRSEVQSLTWRAIDADRELVAYPSTKGGNPRLVPAPTEVFTELGSGGDPEAAVFGPWSRRAWRRALDRSGVKRFRWHDLRHSFCSYLVQRGVPLADVQQMAGHKTIATTMRYAHLAPTDAHDRVRAALSQDRSPQAKVLRMPERG